MKLTLPKIQDSNPLYPIEREMGRIRDVPMPSKWAEEHFKLTSAFAHPGDLTLYVWQREIVNAIIIYNTIMICGPTQIFKSLAAEIMVAYCIDNLPMNCIFCYSKKDVVEDVFGDRIRPLIQEVPAIRKYWSGAEKDLTKRKMRLSHVIMRIASSEVRSDIATFSSGFIYGSEVSKWRKRRGWDPVEALKRRQEPYRILGRHKAIFESSPLFEGDCLDQEMHRPGVIILEPYMPCPHCKQYQVLTDSK